MSTSSKNNTITTTYKNAEFKTLFGGNPGECSMRVLSSLKTLPELASIAPESSIVLNHFYAIHTMIDSDDRSDYNVDIWPILNEKQYDYLGALHVHDWQNNDEDNNG